MKHGIVMEIQANRAFVFTNEGVLIQIPTRKGLFIGQSIPLTENTSSAARQRRWLVPALAAACLVLLVCSGLLLSGLILPQAGPVYLSLDINPSVEFVLDSDRSISDVIPMNSEAWELLAQNNFKGLNYEAAIARWITLTREKMPEKLEQVLISAVLTKRDRSFADKIMSLDSSRSSQAIAELTGLKVKVIYTMDLGVKENADANRLSFGRQMLFEKAQARQPDIGVEDIRSAPLKPLIELLLNKNSSQTIETSVKLATPPTDPTSTERPTEMTKTTQSSPTSTESSETATGMTSPSASKETTSTAAVTIKETTKTTTKVTTKATTKATTAPTTAPVTNLQVQAVINSAEGWKLQWTMSPAGRSLSYYKVVISKTATLPKYPDNGYLYALSREQNYCWVKNTSAYNGGDIGGYLVPGQKYYVGITYVFSDGKSYSNVLQLTYNGPVKTTSTTTTSATTIFNPRLTVSSSDETGIALSWDISPADKSLSYYKVVISKADSTPQYPDNGYLYVLSRETHTCKIDNTDAYTGGDFGDILLPGQNYYFAITYVFSDGKITSNVIRLTYNGPATY